MKLNTTVLTLILLFSSVSAFAGRGIGTQPVYPVEQRGNTTITTNDDRVIYSAKDKQLYSVQNQTVCTNGQCHGRGVATLVQPNK